jgi:hypothetical protein
MTPSSSRKLVMVLCVRHSSEQRLQQAYRQLWRWASASEESLEKKETGYASSGLVRAGLDPASGEGSHD